MNTGAQTPKSGGLSVRDVNLTFTPVNRPPVVALDRLSVDVQPGEFVCVVGASGSGKSTLLRLLAGLLEPTEGELLEDGALIDGPSTSRAMVFQRDNLLPWSTVRANVAYGLTLQGVKRREAWAAADERLRAVGLGHVGDSYPRELSGGMRQRVNIARALAVDPRILLLDEPFAALDAQTREIMSSELLRIWNQDRKTVVFITHQIDEAVYLADRVVVLSAHPGTVKEVVDVPFERPRNLSLKREPEFGRIVDRIWTLIEKEVRGSLGLETADLSTGASDAPAS
ncbi:ABC-type nitrate/sulfonate/bicarbonate transport system, ATPase component [Actinomycetales bacterium JB111]|nr:ABC-type nitrate/sulfonate/bicarbonate transport system, ATPase component [Actinomycetales bacterium JB111]